MTVDADTLPLILAQASKAITSLQNYEEKRISAEKPRISLLGEDVDEEGKALASVWLVLGLQKIPEQRHVKPIKLALPKPWKCAEDELTTVCLITKDPQREYKDLIKPLGLKSVSKIIGVSKLRTKYKPFETRRQLCNGYDVFLADERILPMLPKILGKTFFDKKKIPIPVNLAKRKDLKQELKDAVECTPLHLGSGACISIKIGLANQSPKDLTSNVKSIIEQAVDKIPGKWNNIRSIHMKTAESISLPIYMPELKSLMEDNPWADVASESPVVKKTSNIPLNQSEERRPKEEAAHITEDSFQEAKIVETRKDESYGEIWGTVNISNNGPESSYQPHEEDDFGDFVSGPSAATISQPHLKVLSPLKPESVARKQTE